LTRVNQRPRFARKGLIRSFGGIRAGTPDDSYA
jgi:hypothetical protein